MKKAGQVTMYIIIGIFLAVGIISLAVLFQRDAKIEIHECQTDADCMQVQTTCCPCNSGGEEKCIPKTREAFYQDQLQDCPQDLGCITLYNCDIASCTCVNKTCQAVAN